ncbi:MAG: ral nucleoside transport system permease protein [Solirubrobacterales bacterium]|nr:ral nucleoside transport system permease protein [Solirubrobacterales bacterium]
MIPIADIGIGPFDIPWLESTLILTTPILLAAIGELISERAGVLNVGLEGMMLAGAFFSFLVAYETGSLVLGAVGGVAAGVLFGVVMAVLAVEARADQIVSGVGINIAAIGLTTFLFDQIFGLKGLIELERIGSVAIPGLSSIPEVGPALFDHDLLLYFAFLAVPLAGVLLYRTKWGLSIRAAGETPAAVDTAGVSVRRIRWAGVLTASAMAALAGVFLTLVTLGIFRQEMTAGRGFLALVAVIFGRWHPVGVLGACLVLGGTDALQLRLAGRGVVAPEVWLVLGAVGAGFVAHELARHRWRRPLPLSLSAAGAVVGLVLFATAPRIELPSELWRALPFLIALVVLAGSLARARMPTMLTLPYRRGAG